LQLLGEVIGAKFVCFRVIPNVCEFYFFPQPSITFSTIGGKMSGDGKLFINGKAMKRREIQMNKKS